MIVSTTNAPEHLETISQKARSWNRFADKVEHVNYIKQYLIALSKSEYQRTLESFQTFLPPRLVSAAKNGLLVPFFGAGVSSEAGVPMWKQLLLEFKAPDEIASDPDLENDNLTAAEILAHEIGIDQFQSELRRLIRAAQAPTMAHYLLAQLSQPIYVTTNYDNLFELAWVDVHGGDRPIVITNDTDFAANSLDPDDLRPLERRPLLLKLHGCAERSNEEMILTRTQYRRHYRSNELLFQALRSLLAYKQTVFVGFSHRDPEVSRQVEDVIYKYERPTADGEKPRRALNPPAFYSLQFDMKERTPEVYAARGIVALQPPISLDVPSTYDRRSAGLAKAIVDLLGAMDSTAHAQLDLDAELRACIDQLAKPLERAMDTLKETADKLSRKPPSTSNALEGLLSKLGDLASQGVYLLAENGDVIDQALPHGLTSPRRQLRPSLADRFYVQQARTYRKAFVSDSDASIFNGNSTIFLCQPLGNEREFVGLLFAATQLGTWKLPETMAADFKSKHQGGAFVIVDSNGIALLPLGNEGSRMPGGLATGESEDANRGYNFGELRRLSRRDKLISKVWKNIVPLAQDDEILSFPPDVRMYAVASEVKLTRWKLALVVPFESR